jgi:hypothetical protein
MQISEREIRRTNKSSLEGFLDDEDVRGMCTSLGRRVLRVARPWTVNGENVVTAEN